MADFCTTSFMWQWTMDDVLTNLGHHIEPVVNAIISNTSKMMSAGALTRYKIPIPLYPTVIIIIPATDNLQSSMDKCQVCCHMKNGPSRILAIKAVHPDKNLR